MTDTQPAAAREGVGGAPTATTSATQVALFRKRRRASRGIRRNLARNVRTERIKRGMSRRELAQRCGCDVAVLEDLEAAAPASGPSLALLIQLAQAFDVPLSHLLRELRLSVWEQLTPAGVSATHLLRRAMRKLLHGHQKEGHE